VASTLERSWNEKLLQLQIARDEYDRRYKGGGIELAPEIRDQLLELIRDFPRVWYNPKTSQREKKRILRLMIKDVTIIKNEKITLKIRWQGGAHTIMEIPIPLPAPLERSTPKEAIDRIRELSKTLTAKQVVEHLNREGYITGTRQPFDVNRLHQITAAYGIKNYYDHYGKKVS